MSGADIPEPGQQLNTGEVTEPRVACTVIVMRDSGDGPEVLLVQRNPASRFMGGAWVFPGGAVDEGEDERQTAIREVQEEASIDLGDPDALIPFSRWITPAQVTIRFDTWFFVAEAPEGADPRCDGGECVDLRWIRPQDALDAHAADPPGFMLVFPTIKHLEMLAQYGSVADTLAGAEARKVMPVEPKVLVEGGIAQVLLPGEPGYDS